MHGSSADSLARLVDALHGAVDGEAEASAVADGLFAAADVLRGQPALRRALTDPAAPAEAKSALARGLFDAHLDEAAVELLAKAGGQRWAVTGDLPRALERLAVTAVVRAADAAGEGDRLEDELFSFGQLVAGSPPLRDALSDPLRVVEDKQSLVRSLLDGKVSAETLRLAERSVSGVHPVGRAVEEYGRIAADARRRLVALVRTARPLSAAVRKRLAEVLSSEYGRPVHLNVAVDPALLGGLRVQIGDQVVDGTISTRLDEARRRLAG